MALAVPDAPRPMCPHCKQTIDPKKDILWENTGGQLSVRGVTVVYCAWCGAILGSTSFQILTKTRRDETVR